MYELIPWAVPPPWSGGTAGPIGPSAHCPPGNPAHIDNIYMTKQGYALCTKVYDKYNQQKINNCGGREN